MERVRVCDYLVVAQLFLQDNFLLRRPLAFDDIKPRLLGHWGTCHGINFAYANLHKHFGSDFTFVLGPGHGFPALQANLFYDGVLGEIDPRLRFEKSFLHKRFVHENGGETSLENREDLSVSENRNEHKRIGGNFERGKTESEERVMEDFERAVATLCKEFSWPGGFPSHASPSTPGVICEGGELGYALGTGYGVAAGHPEKTVAVLIGDGEFETATALASMNLVKLFGENGSGDSSGTGDGFSGGFSGALSGAAGGFGERVNGKVIPILHLNGYKITGPTIYGRKSERELAELVRGFGYTPIMVREKIAEAFLEDATEANLDGFSEFSGTNQSSEAVSFLEALELVAPHLPTTERVRNPFIIMKTEKGEGGPRFLDGRKVAGNYLAHQIPLKDAKTDARQLKMLEGWLRSYRVFGAEKEVKEVPAEKSDDLGKELFVDARREIL